MLRALQQSASLKFAAAVAGATVCTLGMDGPFLGARTMSASSSAPPALNPQEWKAFKVAEKQQLNHNTVFLRFALPDAEQVVGLPVASCLITRAQIGKPKDGESPGFVIRPYTPVSRPDAKGHFDLVVKVYPEGVMSKHIGSLAVGDLLEFKGPIMKLPYSANMKKSIGMIAGGTGITPMYQVLQEILSNPEDKTEVSLIYANVSEHDILLKSKLDQLAAEHPNFKVYYVVDKASYGGLLWRGGVGYITADIVKKYIPAPSDDSLVLVCGPPPMMNAISGDKAPDKTQGELSGLLASLNYDKKNVFKF